MAYQSIETVSGTIYNGIVQSETETVLNLKMFDGVELAIDKDKIASRKEILSTITTITGRNYEGFVQRFDSTTVYITTVDSIKIDFKYDQIVDFNDPDLNDLFITTAVNNSGNQTDSASSNKQHKRSIFKNAHNPDSEVAASSKFFMVGVTILLPGVLNALMGYTYHRFHIRGSIGIMPSDRASGEQLNIGICIAKSDHVDHNLTFELGESRMLRSNRTYTQNEYSKWRYFGFGYDINYYGIFGEIGISKGEGDYTSPQLIMQLGYVYRFK